MASGKGAFATVSMLAISVASSCGGDEPSPTTLQTPADPSVASVEVVPGSVTLVAIGETVQLAANARDAAGNAIAGKIPLWSSSDGNVATVSSTGLVTATGIGSTAIKAAIDAVEGSTGVAVLRPEPIKVLSHNVYMLPAPLSPGRVQRAVKIREAGYIKGYDVVLLDELFDSLASALVLDGLLPEYPHQTLVIGRREENDPDCADDPTTLNEDEGNLCWNSTEGAFDPSAVLNGGVAIISKWPIEERVQYVFADGCAEDSGSNKGFAYAKINKNGTVFHVIATHVQAVAIGCSPFDPGGVATRLGQFYEMSGWIASDTLRFPEYETVLIGGDLNVDRSSGNEYQDMLLALNVPAPTYSGRTVTWDPTTNDLTTSGAPLLNGDGVDLNATPQYLDYVFVSENHRPLPGWTNFPMWPSMWPNTWVAPTGDEWPLRLSGRESDEYSDHYPVAGFSDDVDMPPTAFTERVLRYERVQFRSLALSTTADKYIKRSDDGDGWLVVDGAKSDPQTVFTLEPWAEGKLTGNIPFDPYCLTTGSAVRVKSRRGAVDWYWNWAGTLDGAATRLQGRWGYFMKDSDPSDNLRFRMIVPERGCFRHGASVSFLDNSVSGGDQYMEVWPDGSWKNYLFLWSDTNGGLEHRFIMENAPGG